MSVMPTSIDLEAYFDRIGFRGQPKADLATLMELQRLHPQAIAFENLNPFTHRPVSLKLEDIERKLVREKRGGYCFEQNGLFWKVLTQIGFRATGLAARVGWNPATGVITPRGHQLLRVEVDGSSYVCDVGFGGTTLTAPLRLVANEEQQTPHEPFRLVPIGSAYMMEAKISGEWKPTYGFTLEEQFPVDYEVTNYYLSTNEASHFRANLMCARPFDGGRRNLRNNSFVTHRVDGASERIEIKSPGELISILEDLFEIEIPDKAAFEAALVRQKIFGT